ncbi:MAG: hypothetical protein LBG66_06170 [Gallionellaceae bacterium]|jgi:hypothetical protein|nr:hypothetical protein [Gallionellaceae bacterium]
MKRIFSAGALILFAGIAHAADPIGSSKTPQQVADLYMSTMMGNADDAKALNDYLRPEYEGKDAFEVKSIAGMMDNMTKQVAVAMKNELGASDDATNDAIPGFAQAAVDAIKRSACHSTGATVKPNEYKEGDFIAEGEYECHVPDLKKALAPQIASSDGKVTAAGLTAMTTTINATPADKILNGKFALYSSAQHLWETGSPDEVLDAVIDDVMAVIDDTMSGAKK